MNQQSECRGDQWDDTQRKIDRNLRLLRWLLPAVAGLWFGLVIVWLAWGVWTLTR